MSKVTGIGSSQSLFECAPAPFGAFAYTDQLDGLGEGIYFPVSVASEEEHRAELAKRALFAEDLIERQQVRV